MKVLIIEDEKLTARRLQDMLEKYDHTIDVRAILPSVKEVLRWLGQNPLPDLIFMDIHLEDDQCFAIFESVNLDVPVIFTTAYDEYMIQAFKVNSIDYLMKPIDEQELIAAIEKFKRTRPQSVQLSDLLKQLSPLPTQSYKDRFLVSIGSRLRTIEIEDIHYFYYADSITFLVSKDGQRFPIDYSMDKLALLLDPREFFRVNRQTMIAHRAIANMHVFPKGRIKLDLNPALGEEILVSIDRATDFKEWLGK